LSPNFFLGAIGFLVSSSFYSKGLANLLAIGFWGRGFTSSFYSMGLTNFLVIGLLGRGFTSYSYYSKGLDKSFLAGLAFSNFALSLASFSSNSFFKSIAF
tara:strand:- start:444 stop:743 length:300 start_codon:yes stop_codon:yes gene_type:complete